MPDLIRRGSSGALAVVCIREGRGATDPVVEVVWL